MSDHEEQLFARIPRGLKRLVDEDERANKEVVTQALERELGVASEDSVAVFERKVRRTEQELSEAQEALQSDRDRVKALKTRLEEYREIRDQKEAAQDDYDELLDELLDDMEAEEVHHIPAYHPRLDDIATVADQKTDEIHLDLQRRAADQERELAHTRFMDKRRAGRLTPRPIAEEWAGGDDDA